MIFGITADQEIHCYRVATNNSLQSKLNYHFSLYCLSSCYEHGSTSHLWCIPNKFHVHFRAESCCEKRLPVDRFITQRFHSQMLSQVVLPFTNILFFPELVPVRESQVWILGGNAMSFTPFFAFRDFSDTFNHSMFFLL